MTPKTFKHKREKLNGRWELYNIENGPTDINAKIQKNQNSAYPILLT